MKEIIFERTNFIKDLYKPKDLISSFDIIEFESFNVFRELAEKGLYHFEKKNTLIIPIDANEYYDALIELFLKTGINSSIYFILYIKDESVLNYVLKNLKNTKYVLMIDFEIPCVILDHWTKGEAGKWIEQNRFYKRIKINYNNYKQQLNRIINSSGVELIRFFWLDIDYYSFNEMKFGEMKDLAFSLNCLREYMIGKQPIVLNTKRNDLTKKIFVSNDLKLYLNDLKDDIWCFDLSKHLNDDGNSLDKKELNKLRMYIDLVRDALNPYFKQIFNWFYIDFYYNLKIEKTFNQIPLISQIFDRWISNYGFPK